MATFTLSQVLSPAQIKNVTLIANSTPDSIERVKRFKDYYSTFAEDLERQGFEVAYLAYATEHAITEATAARKKRRLH